MRIVSAGRKGSDMVVVQILVLAWLVVTIILLWIAVYLEFSGWWVEGPRAKIACLVGIGCWPILLAWFIIEESARSTYRCWKGK